MGLPYESEAELPSTPPPTYTDVVGGESVEMVETKDGGAKVPEEVNKMDTKEEKEEKKDKEEEEGPPAPPPVGLIELVSFVVDANDHKEHFLNIYIKHDEFSVQIFNAS